MKPRLVAPAALIAVALAAAACGARVPLYAPQAVLASAVQVRTFDAYAVGDRIYARTIVVNLSPQPIIVDRDGFALKLPSGEELPRSSGTTTQHRPYPLAPGQGREVFVDFHATHGLEATPSALLVVGGITFGADPVPRVVGEIPLSPVRP
jgi:predicted small lipoprotein YifL